MQNKTFSERLNNPKCKSHSEIFKVVKMMHEEGISLNDLVMFDKNVINEILEGYYATYDMRIFDENERLIFIKESEVTLPLEERKSGITEELSWLLNNGYDINSHVSFDGVNEKFYDCPVIQVFAFPNDIYMAKWLIEKGIADQLRIKVDVDETIADWCFDNLDICAEDFTLTTLNISPVCKITADLVRLLLQNGCSKRDGAIIMIDNKNLVSFDYHRYLY